MGPRRILLAVFALIPGAAQAHAFSTGKDLYGAFLEGAGVVLAGPGVLVPILALAVALTLWRTEGLLRAWLPYLAGGIVGMILAPHVGPSATLVPLAIGLVVAVLAALVPLARVGPALPVLAGLVGAAVLVAALEGHGWAEVARATKLGILFAANFTLAAAAGLVRWTQERIPHKATAILWRIVASWIAAILVLYLAFLMVGA